MNGTIDLVLPAEERFSADRAGAIATVTLEVALALGRVGVPARVITPALEGASLGDVDVVSLRYGRHRSLAARGAQRALRTLTRRRPDPHAAYRAEVAQVAGDLAVVHNDPPLAAALGAAGRRVVLWLHNLFVGADGAAIAHLPPSVSIVTVSDYVRTWTARTYGLDPHGITVIHNGVDTERFRPGEPARGPELEGVPKGPLRLVCHGRIDPNKGQVLAADAVARLRREGHAVDLTIIGAPQTFGMPPEAVTAYLRDLDRAVRAAGAHRTGRVPPSEIPALLRTFDVALILPTVPDPFPLAGLEAMASGCAVVAVPLGGVDEMVGDAALRVEPTVDAIAGAARRLASDAALLRDYQARGRARALSFTWDAAARTLRDAFA